MVPLFRDHCKTGFRQTAGLINALSPPQFSLSLDFPLAQKHTVILILGGVSYSPLDRWENQSGGEKSLSILSKIQTNSNASLIQTKEEVEKRRPLTEYLTKLFSIHF